VHRLHAVVDHAQRSLRERERRTSHRVKSVLFSCRLVVWTRSR
jgi:hypothetical protein